MCGQALHFGMGGNPFGPAGTGKTESVKALGAQLGRFVLVFNCDENFDYRCATTPPQAQAHKHTWSLARISTRDRERSCREQ